MLLSNSSQPYLYNDNNVSRMLYCCADHAIDLNYGGSIYTIRPWKIKLLDLSNNTSVLVPTVSYDEQYGRVALECNPHIIISNSTIKLYYTVGFMKSDDSPIVYYLCSMTADNLSLTNLTDFTVVQKTFSGTFLTDSELLFVDKIYGKDTLVRKTIGSTNGSLVPVDTMSLEEILRVTRTFDTNQIIITGKTSQKTYVSYLLNNDLSIDKKINNSYGMDIYKCSILNNVLAYTVRNESYNKEDVESRSIVVENIVN
jgi:hypothetical protein